MATAQPDQKLFSQSFAVIVLSPKIRRNNNPSPLIAAKIQTHQISIDSKVFRNGIAIVWA
jgi:hypothetical protein